MEFQPWKELPQVKEEVDTTETKPDIKSQIPFLADLIELEKQSKKWEDNISAECYSTHVCKIKTLCGGWSGMGKVEQYGEIDIKIEIWDSIWAGLVESQVNVQEMKSELDVHQSQLVKQRILSETLPEPTRNTGQIKGETEDFEIIDGNTEDAGLNEDRLSLGNAACSKLSEKGVQTSQKEVNCDIWDSIWAGLVESQVNVQEMKSELDVHQSQLGKQDILSETLPEPTRNTGQIKGETEDFEIIDGNTEDTGLNEDRLSLGKAACSKHSEKGVQTSQREVNCGDMGTVFVNHLKCDVCEDEVVKQNTLIHPVRTHTGESPCKCDVCGKKYSRSDNLRIHKRTHTGEKPYKCDVCGKAFADNSSFIKHKRTHTGEKPYKCDVCGKAFAESSSFIKHKRTHTGEKPYKCDVCGKAFADSSSFIKHKRTHTGEKPYKCDLCTKGFNQNISLIVHKRTHTGEKPYKCDVCGKAFADSSSFIKHKRTHTGEKPYKCDVCGKAFAESSSFKKHKRTHTGEKPYKCDVCGKKYSQSSILRIHKRTHTGEKPYKCDMCCKKYSRSDYLIVHKRTHKL